MTKAFTLIELIATVTVATILTTAGLISVSAITKTSNANAAVATVIDTDRHARLSAMHTDRSHTISPSADRSSLTIESKCDTKKSSFALAGFSITELASDGDVPIAVHEIEFTPDGLASQPYRITLANPENVIGFTVNVSRLGQFDDTRSLPNP